MRTEMKRNKYSSYNYCSLRKNQKYHDFVEIATEAIMEYTKKVDGKEVPMWNREEVDEIVIAQVDFFHNL